MLLIQGVDTNKYVPYSTSVGGVEFDSFAEFREHILKLVENFTFFDENDDPMKIYIKTTFIGEHHITDEFHVINLKIPANSAKN